ncbi:ABC transporter, permease protein [Minicystis rosea]|nr:ABC transporter, permease protein [Minicystis rosea]
MQPVELSIKTVAESIHARIDRTVQRARSRSKKPATEVCSSPMLEPSPTATWTRPILPVALALAGIVLLLDLISIAFGVAPLATLSAAAVGTWGTAYGIGQVLFKATPLIFTGLAFEVAFRAGLFNIGAEGQLALAGLAAGWVGARLPPGTPWIVALPACLAVAVLVGAAVALVPAIMRARLGVHEIISTIMLNRIVDGVVPFALVAWIGASSLRTADVIAGAAVPKLSVAIPALAGSAASFAFPLAVLTAFAVDRFLRRTRGGREMRWTGQNAETCRAEGIDVPRRLVQAMLLSGALAGLSMSATVLGYKGYYELGLGSGAGFTGIAVALLGRGHPLGIVLSAVLFGTLQQAGLAINAHVPKEAMDVLTAAAIVLVAIANRQSRGAPRRAATATSTQSTGPAKPAPEGAAS